MSDPPVVGEEQIEVVEAEPLVGDPELRVRLRCQTAQEHREIVELLELGGLLFRKIRIEFVATQFTADPQGVRRRLPGERVPDRPGPLAPLVELSFGPPNENRSIVPPGRP